jgi:hypothetical protein
LLDNPPVAVHDLDPIPSGIIDGFGVEVGLKAGLGISEVEAEHVGDFNLASGCVLTVCGLIGGGDIRATATAGHADDKQKDTNAETDTDLYFTA